MPFRTNNQKERPNVIVPDSLSAQAKRQRTSLRQSLPSTRQSLEPPIPQQARFNTLYQPDDEAYSTGEEEVHAYGHEAAPESEEEDDTEDIREPSDEVCEQLLGSFRLHGCDCNGNVPNGRQEIDTKEGRSIRGFMR